MSNLNSIILSMLVKLIDEQFNQQTPTRLDQLDLESLIKIKGLIDLLIDAYESKGYLNMGLSLPEIKTVSFFAKNDVRRLRIGTVFKGARYFGLQRYKYMSPEYCLYVNIFVSELPEYIYVDDMTNRITYIGEVDRK